MGFRDCCLYVSSFLVLTYSFSSRKHFIPNLVTLKASTFSDVQSVETLISDKDVLDVLTCISEACIQIADKISYAPIDKLLGTSSNQDLNASGDVVKQLDQICNEILISKLLHL